MEKIKKYIMIGNGGTIVFDIGEDRTYIKILGETSVEIEVTTDDMLDMCDEKDTWQYK